MTEQLDLDHLIIRARCAAGDRLATIIELLAATEPPEIIHEIVSCVEDLRQEILDQLSAEEALAALARKWPGRYHHLPALGNRRYRERLALAGHQPPPVELVDEAAGMAALRRLLSVSPLVILLCGCADAARCHRQIVLEKVHSDQHGVGSYSGAT